MKISLVESNDCWNKQPITEHGRVWDAIEADVESSTPHVQVYSGLIACIGCVEGDQGLFCSAELTPTAVALRGQPVSPEPVASITEGMISGFRQFESAV